MLKLVTTSVANCRKNNKQLQLQKQAQYYNIIILSIIVSFRLFIINCLLLINEPATLTKTTWSLKSKNRSYS